MTHEPIPFFQIGDKVLLKKRPKGCDVPGVVTAVRQYHVWVKIREDKCVLLPKQALEIVP